ncbi:uncharacterized protein F4822DRAFT_301506 [Hypoxylon trugodes]|uniref:uncharacterized protein n=1 Tax=Hypoxylon trugodes TaxID=326681 RepID=UPI00219E9B37|nr:uncharacterized protein F4822DRAFT_301506 [Hypoxylon trugodes]KAI1388079.1 hypothetical protein F4822DRAFT_301506 [Hypoxylon trugodes]
MCFDLYVHYTTTDHDTRCPSIVNLGTGYVVRSPFQDLNVYNVPPTIAGRCMYPHIMDTISPHQFCPDHPGCCRLERCLVCRFSVDTCKTRVKYHHFVFSDTIDEETDISFLKRWLGDNPSLLYLVAFFFKAGVEYQLADLALEDVLRRIEMTWRQGYDPAAAELIRLEAERTRYVAMKEYAAECLGQLALLWDFNTGEKRLPRRPGSWDNDSHDAKYSRRLRLTVMNFWKKEEKSSIQWPFIIDLIPFFRDTGRLVVYEDPSNVSQGLRPESNKDIYYPIFGLECFNFLRLGPLAQGYPMVMVRTTPQTSRSPPPQPEPQPRYRPSRPTRPARPVSPSNPTRPTRAARAKRPASSHTALPPPSSLPLHESRRIVDQDKKGKEKQDEQHEVEHVITHHPPTATRTRATWYKVRWKGDWPKGEEETWVTADSIDTTIVDGYWVLHYDKLNRRRRVQTRRQRQQRKGKY